jgi:hypothetical protein
MLFQVAGKTPPLSSVCRFSAVASAYAGSFGMAPSIAIWAGYLLGLDVAFRHDSGWTAECSIVFGMC